MPDALDPTFRLAQRLHDIRLPPLPESGTEAAWALLLGLPLLAAGLWVWQRRRPVRRAALAELGRLRGAYARDRDAVALAAGLSVLLKRVALARFPRREVAGLTGAPWLAFLDRHGGTRLFSEGAGRALAELPYRPATPAEIDGQRLLDVARQWIVSNT